MTGAGARLALLALFVWTAGTGAAGAQSTADTLTAQARGVLAHETALSRLWPGYWPEGQAFILHDPAVGAVFAAGASPQGPSFRPGPLAGADAVFQLDYPSGAPNTVAYRVAGPESDLETLFHEQFHDFQRSAFRWRGPGAGEYVDPGLIPDKPQFTADVEVERRVLADALLAGDDRSRVQLVRTWLTLRRERLAALDDAIAVIEAEREWTEGTAFYVGLQASALVHGKDPHAVRDRLIGELRGNLAARPGGFISNWFRWRAYGVGGAQAWLLDALGPPDWRQRIEAGQRLDWLLEQAVGRAPPRFARDARRRYNLTGLRAALANALSSAPPTVSSRAEFLALAPRRLVLEMDVPFARGEGLGTSFWSDGMTPLAEGVLALPHADYFIATGEGVRLKTQGLSVLHETPVQVRVGRPIRFRYTVLLPDFTGLEALTALPAGEHALDGLRLEAPGLEMEAPGRVRVEVAGDQITVRPEIAP